jgi:proton-translocating NADH-quinone oxidoreductase chain M
LILLCVWLVIETVKLYQKWFYVLLFLTQYFLIQVFIVLELFLFYISFEAVLIPMFLIIMLWGSRGRRIHAAYQFFFYTLVGSFIFLLALFLVYSYVGTTDYLLLIFNKLSLYHQLILGSALFIAFAVKVPVFPFHIWLPEAHVEAPTAGSVSLAGILLKMGCYGLIRYLLVLASYGVEVLLILIYTISIIGVFYTAFTTIRQIDMKKIIAYSSVGHMSFVVIGLLVGNIEGLEGSIYLMLTHGLISPALFLLVGIIYDRYGSRLFFYYKGLTMIMPVYVLFFYFFILANFSLPGTASFVSEILVVVGVIMNDFWIGSLLFLSGMLGLVYSLWLINRLVSGSLSYHIYNYIDLTIIEFSYLIFLGSLTIYLGFKPSVVLDTLHIPISALLVR